jgi:hypothetical protein
MKTKIKTEIIGIIAVGIVIFGFLLFTQGIRAQSNEKNQNNPDIHITVNKQTDKNGNITKYDSTYSYSYSWSGTDNIPKNADSIIQKLKQKFSFGFEESFNPFGDSTFLFSNGINDPDSIFSGNFGIPFNVFSDKQFEKIMKEHEALIEQFFKQNPFNNEPVFKIPDNTLPEPNATPKKQSYTPGTDL